MHSEVLVQLLAVVGFIGALAIMVKLVAYLRRKTTNTELWATVFEGLTHKTMNLEPLREPEVFIEKQTKKDGQDKDPVGSPGDTRP
ncbi:MAG: hypothetical protein HOC23_00095 [Halieaceae bacterium]|jgi:hypothetical protein|nr:hypothetical protein [Halieaceae bacterium]